jgi:hypothetical protein
MSSLTITVSKTTGEELYFRLWQGEDTLLLTSVHYASLQQCLHGIYKIQIYHEFELKECSVGKTGWQQYAMYGNDGRLIAESPVYALSGWMKDDMNLVMMGISNAITIDRSSNVKFFRRARINK